MFNIGGGNVEIKLSEDGKYILSVKVVENNWWRFKEPKPIAEWSKHAEYIEYIKKNFDFGEQDWSSDEFILFLKKELTDRQKFFYGYIAQEKWEPMEAIIDHYKEKFGEAVGATIAGLQAPITRKCRSMKRENFWESKFVEEENRYYYRIKPKYIEDVKRALTE